MAHTDAAADPAEEVGWGERIRRAPAGVLILGALLLLVGALLVVGGVYQGLSRADAGWIPWVMALLMGPLLVYVAVHLVRLTRWAWLVMVLLLALLLASSLVRAVAGSESRLSPLLETAVEAGLLAYLARRPVRRAFQRG